MSWLKKLLTRKRTVDQMSEIVDVRQYTVPLQYLVSTIARMVNEKGPDIGKWTMEDINNLRRALDRFE